MIVFSRDEKWAERLRRLAGQGGWAVEARADLPRVAREAPSEHALIVLDRALTSKTPADAVKILRVNHPLAAIVLACADSELGADAVSVVLSSGADETVGKSWEDWRLLSLLSAVRDRAIAAAVRVSADGALKAERRSRRVFARARAGGRWAEVPLPAAEFSLLWLLLSADGEAVSRARLLDALGAGAGREVEAETVSRRVLSLRRALAPWKGAIETVRGGFYRLVSSARRRSMT